MHIRLATLADCSTTASFSVLGFDNDELFEWMSPRRREYPDHFRYHFLRHHQTRYWSPEHVFYVAITDEEDEDWSGASQVIGYAIWQRRGESDAAELWRRQDPRSRNLLINCSRARHTILTHKLRPRTFAPGVARLVPKLNTGRQIR